MSLQRRDIELVRRIEAAGLCGCRPSQQPIGADDAVGAGTLSMVDNQKVVAVAIEGNEVAAHGRHFGRWLCRHILVKYLITQRLRRFNLGVAPGEPKLEVSRPDADGARL